MKIAIAVSAGVCCVRLGRIAERWRLNCEGGSKAPFAVSSSVWMVNWVVRKPRLTPAKSRLDASGQRSLIVISNLLGTPLELRRVHHPYAIHTDGKWMVVA